MVHCGRVVLICQIKPLAFSTSDAQPEIRPAPPIAERFQDVYDNP